LDGNLSHPAIVYVGSVIRVGPRVMVNRVEIQGVKIFIAGQEVVGSLHVAFAEEAVIAGDYVSQQKYKANGHGHLIVKSIEIADAFDAFCSDMKWIAGTKV
jgi:hypothetical protein